MMAAARILIWLPVRLVRRSSISNMTFPLGACSFLYPSGRRACAPHLSKGYLATGAIGKPVLTRGTSALERWGCRTALHKNNCAGGLNRVQPSSWRSSCCCQPVTAAAHALHFLVFCRYRHRLSDIRDLTGGKRTEGIREPIPTSRPLCRQAGR